tara:strand:+ start:847 stop:2205 length:1359 start_codon:yes stop_codon:yes gene_type:complete
MKVRTRFAPSPTGYLHVGGLRTALYNYLFAKQNNGQFILRIEDTDQNRLVENAIQDLQKTLNICNLEFDEYPDRGDFGPYVQSQRLNIYKKYYLYLIEHSFAYPCFFDEKTPDLLYPEFDVKKALEKIKNQSFVIKLFINKDDDLIINDGIRGDIKFDLNLIDDPIIIKSDGFPTYHFANVIDDHLMKITHVIRGEEWISSLPIHVTLYKVFQWSIPRFYHLPLLLNEDKSKLSKRQGDVAVEDFLLKGYLKDALINFVALLGWHPSNDDEIFSLKDLENNFKINRVNKAGAIFDIKKLKWMNNLYIKNSSDKDLSKHIKEILKKENLLIPDELKLIKIIQYSKSRINTLYDVIDIIKMFDSIPDNYLKIDHYNYKDLFAYWIQFLKKTDTINEDIIKNLISATSKDLNIAGKNLFIPIRFGLINLEHGPDLFSIINIIGIKESIKRLENGI